MPVQKIRTYLWFDDQAEDAIDFYCTLFQDSRVVSLSRGPDGKLFVGEFVLDGVQFMAINGGPRFRFTEAMSLFVTCESQEEVDRLWSRLTADGGEESMCGWLKDRFGVSWQIIPSKLVRLLHRADDAGRERVTRAMLQMRKIEIAELEAAARGADA